MVLGCLLTGNTPSTHAYTPNTSANTYAHDLETYALCQKHTCTLAIDTQTRPGGASMRMNGRERRSGSMLYWEAREEGIWVPTGTRAAIFATGGKQQENARQEEEQQTSLKKCKQRQIKRNQTHTAEILHTFGKQAKIAEQKEAKTHRTS